MLIELRYSSQTDVFERSSGLVDGINDIVLEIADRFSLDILSVSHILDDNPHRNHSSITCTAVCALNGKSVEKIANTLKAENDQGNGRLYCFLDASNKLSVRVGEISYN